MSSNNVDVLNTDGDLTYPDVLRVAKQLNKLKMVEQEIVAELKEVKAEIRRLKLEGRCRRLSFVESDSDSACSESGK
jgi:predicted RNA-binding protein